MVELWRCDDLSLTVKDNDEVLNKFADLKFDLYAFQWGSTNRFRARTLQN